MLELDLALALRNALLLQFLVILMLSDHAAVAVHRHLRKAWRRVQAPLLAKRKPRKANRFWQIDMTKFEP